MARFRQTVLSACWLIPAVANFYFGMLVLSMFSASPKPSTNPITPPTKYTPEAIKKTMFACITWMTALVVSSVSILSIVRRIVETAAEAEIKGNIFEEESYKLAREELKQAIKAVDDALDALAALAEPTADSLNLYVDAVGKRNVATAKVARTKPKEGLARLPRGMQQRVRLLFLLVIVLFFAAGIYASVAFYLSLCLHIGCAGGVSQFSPFVLVGIILLLGHLQAVRVAFKED